MNAKTLLFAASLIAAVGVPKSFAANSSASSAQVTVNFDHPEKFKDVKDSASGDNESSSYLADFRSYLQRKAPHYLAAGQKLTVTFTDIDMAGEYEPWLGPRARDSRIIKDIYVPRLDFDYLVTDASGAIVKHGHEDLTDLNFQNEIIGVTQTDPMRYEKSLLDRWLQSDLGRSLKNK